MCFFSLVQNRRPKPSEECLPGDLGFRIHHSLIVIFNYSFSHSLIRLFDCLIVCLFVCCNIDLRQVSRTCEFSPLSAPLKEQANNRSNLHSACCSIDSALRIYYFVIDPLIHENLWEARKGAEVGSAIYLSICISCWLHRQTKRKKEGRKERKKVSMRWKLERERRFWRIHFPFPTSVEPEGWREGVRSCLLLLSIFSFETEPRHY